MTLAALRARAALRTVTARPVWAAVASTLLVLSTYGAFRLVRFATVWIYDYPLIGSIAPAITQRSLEGLFLMLMAAVLFSVLIASIGTLYGSHDLELLLAQPVSSARVLTVKVAELFINTAGLPLAFTIPVLAGIGAALEAPASYYIVSTVAAIALYASPVTAGALLGLALVRVAPVGRVREVATAVSITAAAAAVVALRALRPEQLATVSLQDSAAFEQFLGAFARLELGWLPTSWASNASWAALEGKLSASFVALLLLATSGLVLTGTLANLAYARGWMRSIDTQPPPRAPRSSAEPRWERALTERYGTVAAIMIRDARSFRRDVQQWSQLLVLVALAAVYLLSLNAIPVPTQQFKNVMGTLNIAFVSFLTAGVALRVAYPAVSYEGGAYWLTQVNPIRKLHLVLAKFLFALPIMLVLSLGLGVAAMRVLDLSPTLAVAAPLMAAFAAFAMTGLATGLGAANPRFDFTDPNELVMTPGAVTYMALALTYAVVSTALLARPAWSAINDPNSTGYWWSGEGLAILTALTVITALTTVLPLWRGTRNLHQKPE